MGSPISDSKTAGKTCVPVAMSQPALNTDHVQTSAAINIAVRITPL
jgi:hypothetical protein